MKDISNDVKKLRSFFSMSRNTLSIISGIGKSNIATYENGSIPSKSNYILLTAMMNINTFNILFISSKQLLRKNVVIKIESIIVMSTELRERKVSEYRYDIMNIKKNTENF